MRKPVSLLLILVAALLGAAPASNGEILGLFGKKKEKPEPPTARDEGPAQAIFAKAESLEKAGDTAGAIREYRTIAKQYGRTAAAAKAQFKVGQYLERSGDINGAFKAYSDYVSKHAGGGDFDAVIKAQFNIAKTYLDGEKKRMLGMSIGTQYQKAEEMFKEIVTKAPYHPLAPAAQFNVGMACEKAGKPVEALMAYQEVMTRYSNDPVADDAQYQIGYVQMREAQTGSYDTSSRVKAREAFEDFVNRYPNSEKSAQARENIKLLSGGDIKSSMEIARFYDRTKNYKAAVVYYNDVIRLSPGSDDSNLAKKRIEELKSTVGEDALRAGPEKAESGASAAARRRSKAKVDLASRPDFNGPQITLRDPPNRPRLRTGGNPVPAVEPPLPAIDPLQGNPLPGDSSPEPLIPPSLPPPEADKPKKNE